jgi:NitT/TauT family transport system substrate-binding protein
MIAAFQTDDVQAVVTWNPLVSTIMETPGQQAVRQSDIPGEIIDMMVVNTETLEANPDFGKALVGAWYEVMGLMAARRRGSVLTAMAEASGTDLAGYKAQLASTEMFYDPGRCRGLHPKPALPETMVNVAEFLFDKGILGEGAPSADFVGVEYPDGVVTGDPNNVQFRFDTTYMQMAADGAL